MRMRERLLRLGVTIEKLLITATLRIHKESMTYPDVAGRGKPFCTQCYAVFTAH